MRTEVHANALFTGIGTEGLKAHYRRAKPRALKVMEFDHTFFREMKEQNPGLIIVGRPYEGDQSFSNAAQARFIRRSVDMAREYPEVSLWEGYNETAYDVPNGIVDFARMEVNRVRALADVGAHAAVGCFSCGQPPLPEGTAGNDGGAAIRAFLPAIREAMAHEGVLALHEYDAPWMSRMIRGPHWDIATEGWLCLRYRKLVKWLRIYGIEMYHPVYAPRGLKIGISESGVDGGVQPRPGGQGGGWWDFRNDPDPVLGDYAAQRYWYQWQVSHDRYVEFCTSFGDLSVDPKWHSFGMFKDGAMTDRIVELESKLPRGHMEAPVNERVAREKEVYWLEVAMRMAEAAARVEPANKEENKRASAIIKKEYLADAIKRRDATPPS